jgi:hypothetical protein
MAVEFKQDSILDWLLETQDKSTIKDTAEHGCSGGTISELIYYADTSADSILHLIVTFNGSKEVGSNLQLQNLLAWWAAEEVCRGICMDWDDEERATA